MNTAADCAPGAMSTPLRGNVEELAANIDDARRSMPARWWHAGFARLLANLKAAIVRFNQFANDGKDLDFHRGERGCRSAVQRHRQGGAAVRTLRCGPSAIKGPTMRRS